jgi:hypothetical protein
MKYNLFSLASYRKEYILKTWIYDAILVLQFFLQFEIPRSERARDGHERLEAEFEAWFGTR